MKAVKKTAVNVGRLFVIIIAVIIALGSAIGVTALIDSISAIKTKQVFPSYTIGMLDEEGKHEKNSSTLYSDLFECQGLTITQSFDSSDMYFQVFYYYPNEVFAEKTEIIETGYYDPESIPEDVMYARVLLYPQDRQIISWYNKIDYTTDLKIEVDIEQTVNYKNYLVGLEILNDTYYTYNTDSSDNSNYRHMISSTNTNYDAYIIDVTNLDAISVVLKSGNPIGQCFYYLVCENDYCVKTMDYSKTTEVSCKFEDYETSQDITKVYLLVPKGCEVEVNRAYFR